MARTVGKAYFIARRLLGVLVWVVILGPMIPAYRLSIYISGRFEGALSFFLSVGLVIVYLVGVGVIIFLFDKGSHRLFARFGWDYYDDQTG